MYIIEIAWIYSTYWKIDVAFKNDPLPKHELIKDDTIVEL